jgi:hypothetical protein
MTRDKAVKVSHLLFRIETLETLHDEILNFDILNELSDEELKEELLNAVSARLDKALKELEEM